MHFFRRRGLRGSERRPLPLSVCPSPVRQIARERKKDRVREKAEADKGAGENEWKRTHGADGVIIEGEGVSAAAMANPSPLGQCAAREEGTHHRAMSPTDKK